MERETWKDVAGFEGIYKISDAGCVKTIRATHKSMPGRIISPYVCGGKYLVVSLNRKKYYIHRLVAAAFCEQKSPDRNCINHVDGNKLNNSPENLRWCTYSENQQHAYDTGLNHTKSGFDSPVCVTTKEQREYIYHAHIESNRSIASLAKELKIKISTAYRVMKVLRLEAAIK